MKDEVITRLFSPGSWIRLPIQLLHRFSSNEVIVLAEAINQSVVSGSDCFFYSVEDFENRTGFTVDVQKRALKSLAESGIILLGKKGLPARRTIEIDWDAVGALISEKLSIQSSAFAGNDPQLSQGTVSAELHSQASAELHSHQYTKKQIKNTVPGGFELTPKSVSNDDEFDVLVKKMYEILAQKRKIFRPPNLKSWAKCVREFSNESGFTVEEINEVLVGYLERVDEEFAPLAFSATSFVAKWNNIKAFVERSKKSKSPWEAVL